MKPEEVNILVAVLALALATVAFLIDQRDKRRSHRFIAGVLLLLLLIGIAFALWLRTLRPAPPTAPERNTEDEPRPPGIREPLDTVSTTVDTGKSPISEQDVTPPPYQSWLTREGSLIRYNAARYMPGSCPGRIMAVGDFGSGGWTSGPLARCERDGWLTFDAGQLLREPGFVPGHTYCLNFVDSNDRYGQHGAPPRAPGLASIEVPAKEGAQVGLNIGFRVIRSAGGVLVEFTNEGVQHCE